MITDVRITLVKDDWKLRAFASLVIDDCFIVHDCRVIAGEDGLFLSMPSRRICEKCPGCGCRNKLRAKFCNDCGLGLKWKTHGEDRKPYTDVAHPITNGCRKLIEDAARSAYEHELYSFRK